MHIVFRTLKESFTLLINPIKGTPKLLLRRLLLAPNIPDLRFTYESFCARIDAVDPADRKKHALCKNAKYHLIRILSEINK